MEAVTACTPRLKTLYGLALLLAVVGGKAFTSIGRRQRRHETPLRGLPSLPAIEAGPDGEPEGARAVLGLPLLLTRPPVSQLREDTANTETIAWGPRTTAGTILGTAPHMSAEQIEGGPLDARSDIFFFFFGLVHYEMLACEPAFIGNSTITTPTAVLRDQPRGISELASDVPSQFENSADCPAGWLLDTLLNGK